MPSFFQRREKLIAAFLIGLFFLLNLSIAARSPLGGWMDEVVFVDPALNLATGKGWTSSAWLWQTDHDFWAVNSPLYPAGLYLWVHLFGISMIATRAYCYFLGALAVFLLWLGAFRFNLLTPGYRLLWLVILSTEYGMNWIQRNERYDIWIFLGLALAWAGASLRIAFASNAVIFTGCFLVPWGGFVGGPYVVLMATLATLLTGFKFGKKR